MNGCTYPKALASKLNKLDSTFKDFMYLKDELVSANSKEFNKTEDYF